MAKNRKVKRVIESASTVKQTSPPPKPKVSFDWRELLDGDKDLKVAPVSLFSNIRIKNNVDKLIRKDLRLEVLVPKDKLPDLPTDLPSNCPCFWFAVVVQVKGFFVQLRWEGYENDDEDDFWINICDSRVHPVGYAQSKKLPLIPLKVVTERHPDIKKYVLNRLLGHHTLNENFKDDIRSALTSNFKKGMTLEVIDINKVSSVRPGTIVDVKGTRLQVSYHLNDKIFDHTNSLWCDEKSNLIHPVGWAQLVGHELVSTKDYAESSKKKIETGQFDENDASFSYFPHLYHQMENPYLDKDTKERFKINMRVEVIDALNLKSINVATVLKVLRFNYLMVGIDGMTADDGTDAFCLHCSECLPILPKSYTQRYKIPLTTPDGKIKKNFDYKKYLKDAGAIAAPECLFKDDLPDKEHTFKTGQYLEAVDLMEPHLICPAFVKQVAGKLLKISFPGWSADYDQWVDYRSPEIYPAGYCQITGYMLEQPENWLEENTDNNKEQLIKQSSSSLLVNRSFANSRVSISTTQPKTKTKTSNKRKNKSKDNTARSGKNFKRIKETVESTPTFFDFSDESSIDELTEHQLNSASSFVNDENQPTTFSNQAYQSDLIENVNEIHHQSTPTTTTSSDIVSSPNLPMHEQNQTKQSSIKSNHPSNWSVKDVEDFLNNEGFSDLSEFFVKNEITGAELIGLRRERVFEIIECKLGPSLKIFSKIEELKKKFRIN